MDGRNIDSTYMHLLPSKGCFTVTDVPVEMMANWIRGQGQFPVCMLDAWHVWGVGYDATYVNHANLEQLLPVLSRVQ